MDQFVNLIYNNKRNIMSLKQTQETVEEAANIILFSKYPYHPPQDHGHWIQMFKEGSKWQKEKEELINPTITPKEYSKELIKKFMGIENKYNQYLDLKQAKECASRSVDLIFDFMKMDDEYNGTSSNANSIWVNYFLSVKKEIELL